MNKKKTAKKAPSQRRTVKKVVEEPTLREIATPKSTQVVVTDKIEQVLITGDLKALSPVERLDYYKAVCKSLNLNPLTQPFDYIVLNNKLTLYAKKGCAEQLRKNLYISIYDQRMQIESDMVTVTVFLQDGYGRKDTGTGVVNIKGLAGDAKANAIMKAETKAKRRGTLSMGGLGMLDETEIETIPLPKNANDYSIANSLPTSADPVSPREKASDTSQEFHDRNEASSTPRNVTPESPATQPAGPTQGTSDTDKVKDARMRALKVIDSFDWKGKAVEYQAAKKKALDVINNAEVDLLIDRIMGLKLPPKGTDITGEAEKVRKETLSGALGDDDIY
jgi:hypothetical protein